MRLKETTQEKILHCIKLNPTTTRKELAAKAGLTQDGIKYHLDLLKKEGKIKHIGSTKKGKWLILK